jgi:DNA-binding NtrC family response regulator
VLLTNISQTVLLLASEGAIREVIQDALETEGYFVVTAPDLGAAQESLKDCTPDLFMVRPTRRACQDTRPLCICAPFDQAFLS